MLTAGAILLAGVGWTVPHPGGSVFGQEGTESGTEDPIQIKDGKILSQQRIWILGKDGRPLMQYTLEELRELERVYRETTQLPPLLQAAELTVVVGDGSASVAADFLAHNGGVGGLVRRFNLGLKNCQLTSLPDFSVVEESDSSSERDSSSQLGVEQLPETPVEAESEQDSEDQEQADANAASIQEPIGIEAPRDRGQEDVAQQRVIPTADGYQWLMLSSIPRQFRLSLNAKTVVDRASDRHSMTIDLPMVQSFIIVQLPANAVDERVSGEDLIVSRAVDSSSVKLEIRSRGGPFTLSWGQKDSVRPVGIVEARSETVYEPFDLSNPSQSWTVTTNLSVRWVAANGNQKIQVRLPSGGQWGNLPYSDIERFRLYTLSESAVAPESSVQEDLIETESAGPADILVIENLDPVALMSIDNLSLQWRWNPIVAEASGPASKFTLHAPEVTGVDSHEGMMRVVYPASYEFSYMEHAETRFMDHNTHMDSGANRDHVLFGFSGTKAGVDISFRRERLLPTVRPTYRVHVTENRLELTTWLHCWFDGGSTEIAWYPSGWTLDEATTVVLREPDSPLTGNTEPLQVQSREDGGFLLSVRQVDAASNKQREEQVWRVVAYRRWNPLENPRVDFQLPAFDRGIAIGQSRLEYGSGRLIITNDQVLNVQHDLQTSQGIWQDSAQPDAMAYLQPQVRNPAFFRFLDQGQRPEWTGTAHLLPQQIGLEQNSTLDVQADRVGVTQHFDLRIANRPLSQLKFLVRKDMLPLRLVMDEVVLPYEELPIDEAANAGTQEPPWQEILVSFSPELVGESRLTAESSVAWPSKTDSTAQAKVDSTLASQPNLLEVPLVRILPGDSLRSGRAQWELIPNLKYDVRYRPQDSSSEVYQPVGQGTRELEGDQATILLTIQQRAAFLETSVVANGIYLQTLLAGSERRDRLAVRVRSSSRQLTIQLPEQAVLEKVAVDGVALSQEMAPYDYNANQVAVLLPDESEHILEVIYLVSQPLTWAQMLNLVPASIVNLKSMDRYYWQLVTPDVYHLGWCPPDLTAEWQWQWSTAWWNRVSDLDQTALERWIGAASLTRTPIGTNSYVMSGVEQPSILEVWILSRFAFWQPVGIAAIVGSLLVLNIPWLRSPNAVIIIVGLMATTTISWPELSVLLGQTTLAALSLVVLVWLVQSAVSSRVKRRSIFSSGSQVIQEISGSNPSARIRQSSFTNATNRPAAVESTGTE